LVSPVRKVGTLNVGCVVRAAFLAAAEEQPLGQSHLLRAIRLEYRSVGKLAVGGPLE
jgi:hypothetical protein